MGLREWIWRAKATLGRHRFDSDVEEEMRFHLEMETQAGLQRGLSPEEARRKARIKAGALEPSLEQVRDERGMGWFDGAWGDLRQAAVGLSRQKGFAAVALAAISLAAAANTLIFALADGVVWRPLPYPHSEELVRIFDSGNRYPNFPVSIANFREYQRASQTLSALAIYTGEDVEFMHGERPERVTAVRVSSGFFPLLGASPMLGRNFEESEMRGDPRVAILGYSFWRNRFHGDRKVVGQSIRVNRETWTVIGVLPPGFEHVGGEFRSPLQGDTVALWWPVKLDISRQATVYWHFMNAVGRLKPGVTAAQAEPELTQISLAASSRRSDDGDGWRARVRSLQDEVVGRSRQTVWLLLGAGVVVLLIACTNVAGLSVARALARRGDLAVRQALGAGLWRLVRTQVSENLLLGLAGGVVGLALSLALLPLMRAVMPVDFPRLHAIRMSLPAVAFALSAGLITSVVAGLIPAFRQARKDPLDGLSEDRRGASASRGIQRLRASLVAAQVALALLLCLSAAWLVRSAEALEQRPHGFHPEGVLTFELNLPVIAYQKPVDPARLFRELEQRWQALPGVVSAGFSTNLPWSGYDENASFSIKGRPTADDASPTGRFQAASPGYFAAMGMKIVEGRGFEARDQAGKPLVAVINESLARRYFPNQSPIGQVATFWGPEREIIGVVQDIRDHPADAQAEPAYWMAMDQQPFWTVKVAIRTTGDPLALAGPAAGVIRELDHELPIANVRTMASRAAASLAERRFAMSLVEGFSALALALAAFGIYGLMSYSVEQRRKEIGIRSALGATPWMIAGMVLRDGARVGGVGLLAGLTLAPLAGRALSGFLYGISAWDFTALLIAPAVMAVVAVTATLAPAWTASRPDAVSSLRDG